MIATVRIAPVEHWCPHIQKWADAHPEMFGWPGRVIRIETETKGPSLTPCGHDEWEVPYDWAREHFWPSWFREENPCFVLECMLEMD
jgi:hypothetical protein